MGYRTNGMNTMSVGSRRRIKRAMALHTEMERERERST